MKTATQIALIFIIFQIGNIEIPVKTLIYTHQNSPEASDILICIN